MFCPNCGQQQITQEIKFCSRCGFPLGLVSEILAHGGFLPQLAELYKSKTLFSRRNGLIFSLFWFMIFVLILTPLFGIADLDNMAGVFGLIGTMGAMMIMAASFLILKKEPTKFDIPQNTISSSPIKNIHEANQTALPPQQTQPAQSYVAPVNSWKAANTGDLVHPNSVTEETTKLLNKEMDKN